MAAKKKGKSRSRGRGPSPRPGKIIRLRPGESVTIQCVDDGPGESSASPNEK